MKRVLLMGAAAAAFGLGMAAAQAGPRLADVASGARNLSPGGKSAVSSAKKKNKAKTVRATQRRDGKVRSGRNGKGRGDDRREESGSGM
jgi:hypothetical protein